MSIAQQIATASRSTYLSDAASDFVELKRIHWLAAKSGNLDHLQIARTRNVRGRVLNVIEKTAVTPMATTDPGAEALLQQLAEAFLASLGVYSSFDQILNANGFLKVPLRTRVFAVTLAGSAYRTNEADAKPITRLQLAANQLQYWKSVGIVVLSDELVRSISPAATDFIANALREAVGRTSDQVFTDLLTGTTGAPSTPSTGTDAASFMSDLADALALISYGATSKLFLIVPPALDRRLITMRDNGGAIMVNGVVGSRIKVVCSDTLTDTAILLDASQVAAASDTIKVDQSRASALMLDDNPTSPPQLVSLFQNNLIAERAERFFGCEVMRDDCLCLITGISATA